MLLALASVMAPAVAVKAGEGIDLQGLTLMPSFIDAHSHYINTLSVASQAKLYAPPAGPGKDVESIITELKNSTYFARLILKQQNELGTKLVEIDARPSDCLALATAQKRPLYVTASLFNQVEDMSKWLEEINQQGSVDND